MAFVSWVSSLFERSAAVLSAASSRALHLYTIGNLLRLRRLDKFCFLGSEVGNKSLDEDSPSTEEPSKPGHDCILQMNMGFTEQTSTDIWILDSGVSHHMVSDASLYVSPFQEATPVVIGDACQAHDGSALTAAGVGTISCENFHIPDVPYVPGMTAGLNLVSVQQLADRDYLVMFGGGQCSVIEQSSGKIVGKGRLHADDGLYHLEFLKITPDNADAKDCTAQ